MDDDTDASGLRTSFEHREVLEAVAFRMLRGLARPRTTPTQREEAR